MLVTQFGKLEGSEVQKPENEVECNTNLLGRALRKSHNVKERGDLDWTRGSHHQHTKPISYHSFWSSKSRFIGLSLQRKDRACKVKYKFIQRQIDSWAPAPISTLSGSYRLQPTIKLWQNGGRGSTLFKTVSKLFRELFGFRNSFCLLILNRFRWYFWNFEALGLSPIILKKLDFSSNSSPAVSAFVTVVELGLQW